MKIDHSKYLEEVIRELEEDFSFGGSGGSMDGNSSAAIQSYESPIFHVPGRKNEVKRRKYKRINKKENKNG